MMEKQVQIVKATDQECLKKVFAIRKIVFVEEQNCPPDLEWEFEEESNHFLALYNDVAVGACRWRKTEKGYKLERFAVLKDHRGKGIGKLLVKAVIADLPEDLDYVYLHAQIQAVDFYNKLNFFKEGPQFEEAGIQHFKMVLQHNI